ncbi:MAG: hypothetical protein J7K04_11255 [Spirochaetales bacterium]|nr:hypothetical protein [Spirochaetales bacterium]
MDESETTAIKKDAIVKGDYFRVKILHSNSAEIVYCTGDFELYQGDKVIITTRYGNALGSIQGKIVNIEDKENSDTFKKFVRKATEEDIFRFKENKKRENKAFGICLEKIKEQKLDMKLVQAHYLIDEAKILFFFTAEARVDFRELVKELVAVFRMRIELRQIGVRDESRILGGLGVCGRAFCCNSFADKLMPVSIKMAKEQNLTLNSIKISGPCGRLLCCLAYEYDTYCSIKKELPSEGLRIAVRGKNLKILEVNILVKSVKLVSEDGRIFEVGFDDFYKDSRSGSWKIKAVLDL